MWDGLADDRMLVVADIDKTVGKRYRAPIDEDIYGLASVVKELAIEPPFGKGLSAVPLESIPTNVGIKVAPSLYGYQKYGELCNNRQTLGLVRLTRIIDSLAQEYRSVGPSVDYVAALVGYAASNLVRRLNYSTRELICRSPARRYVIFSPTKEALGSIWITWRLVVVTDLEPGGR